MIHAIEIEFFKNLAQYEYNNQYYDFHNDYNCEKLSYSNGILLLQFKSVFSEISLSLEFTNVKIVNLNFFNIKEVDGLTLDNLYRGRVELNGELIGISENDKGYFYLEFYEGQRVEFWASGLDIR